jgi:transposase
VVTSHFPLLARRELILDVGPLLELHPGALLLSRAAREARDIKLFDTSKQLVSYAGLAASTRQSSETTRHGGITKRGRKRLRTFCIQAVLAMVNRTETPLMKFYQNVHTG